MAYISVSDYALRKGKDPGNIRRLLAAGRIEGTKIGKQWVLDENAEYPADMRIVSGIYKNSRKKAKFYSHRCLSGTITQMVNELRDIYGDLLVKAVLYGSYARGEETEESDVDIALLIDGDADSALYDKMIACVSKCELECNKVLSVIDIDVSKYNQWIDTLPFYRNIEREGIVLWTRS